MRLLKVFFKLSCIVMIGMVLIFIYSIKVEPYLSIVKSHVLNDENFTEKVRVVQVSDVQISKNFTAEHLK